MGTFRKYVLMQVPGLIIAALVLTGLWHFAGLSRDIAIGLLLLWVVKDLSLYPFLRRAYESDVKTGAARLVGTRGVTRQRLAPGGYILLRGELWQAEIEPGGEPIPTGSQVIVVAAHRHRLTVILDLESDSSAESVPPQAPKPGFRKHQFYDRSR